MQDDSESPPRAPPIKYTAPLGTRWAKEKAAAGGAAAFDLPTDPKSIGPWILGECIGKGASGRVKIARHRRTRQLAAVKILPIAPLVNSRASLATQQAKSEKQRLGIDREITMMKLMNHPNIMRIYDVYEGEKELFLVLEYVEGGELFDFLVNRGRLPPPEALLYFRQIIYGLNYAHTFSIIHRDLKPENILIASLSPPIIKIADWGMAAFAPPSLQLETSCGSPHYASPEIVNGEKYFGTATDIWSCGVILYALLTGRLPFDDKNVRTLLSKVKSGKYDIPSWIDPLAKDLLTKMLVVDVQKRITIPDILVHPWFNRGPAIASSTATDSTTLPAPFLPPSPSTLARPIASPDLIDPELFSSLRIIWGRHTDVQGLTIQRDLCSPAGQGVHAKAFYFLLNKYRDESLRNRSNDSMDEPLNSRSNAGLHTDKLYLGWDLDSARVARKLDAGPPGLEKAATEEAERSASVSTVGHLIIVEARATDGTVPVARSNQIGRLDSKKRQSHSYSSSPGMVLPRSSISSANSAIPRASVAKRGYTHSVSHSPGQTTQEPRRVTDPIIPSAVRSLPGTPLQTNFFNVDYQISQDHQGRSSVVPSLAALNSSRPSSHSAMDVDIPSFPPRLVNAESRASTAYTVPRTGVLQSIHAAIDNPRTTGGDATTAHLTDISNPTAAPDHKHRPRPRLDASEKENSMPVDDGWTHVDTDKTRGRSAAFGMPVNRQMGKEIGNHLDSSLTRSNTTKIRKDKERKSRPPPLELPSGQHHQRRTMINSPLPVPSPALLPPGNSSKIMASPVVGEFKGWFSNLFSWKGYGATPSSAIFYSSEDSTKSKDPALRMFQSLGFSISRTILDINADNSEIYHCRLDQSVVDSRGVTMKPVRLRLEFNPTVPASPFSIATDNTSIPGGPLSPNPNFLAAPGRSSVLGGRVSSHNTSLTTPLLPTHWEVPLGCACVVGLTYEKGSVSTFRLIRQRLRDLFADSTDASPGPSPCFSPTLPSTPYTTETHQRLGI